MNYKMFALTAAAGSCMLTASANADLVGVTVLTVATGQGPNSDLTTYHVAAQFDHPADIMNGVGGAAGLASLDFMTDDPNGLYNSGAGGIGPNLYNPYGPALDSFLTLDFFPGAVFTPNFMSTMTGDSGGAVAGTNWSVPDDGYFMPGGVPVGAGNAVIANFVVRDGFNVSYSGTVGWVNNVLDTDGLTPFSASSSVPAPGALALLGLAGLVGVRRRR